MVATPVVAENRYLDDSSGQLPERSVGRAYDRQGGAVVFDPGGQPRDLLASGTRVSLDTGRGG